MPLPHCNCTPPPFSHPPPHTYQKTHLRDQLFDRRRTQMSTKMGTAGPVGFGTPRAQSHALLRFPTKKSSGPILGTAFRSPFGDRLAVPFWVPLFGPAVVSTAEQSWTKGRDDTQWLCCTVSEREPQTHERIAPHANWSSAAWWVGVRASLRPHFLVRDRFLHHDCFEAVVSSLGMSLSTKESTQPAWAHGGHVGVRVHCSSHACMQSFENNPVMNPETHALVNGV